MSHDKDSTPLLCAKRYNGLLIGIGPFPDGGGDDPRPPAEARTVPAPLTEEDWASISQTKHPKSRSPPPTDPPSVCDPPLLIVRVLPVTPLRDVKPDADPTGNTLADAALDILALEVLEEEELLPTKPIATNPFLEFPPEKEGRHATELDGLCCRGA